MADVTRSEIENAFKIVQGQSQETGYLADAEAIWNTRDKVFLGNNIISTYLESLNNFKYNGNKITDYIYAPKDNACGGWMCGNAKTQLIAANGDYRYTGFKWLPHGYSPMGRVLYWYGSEQSIITLKNLTLPSDGPAVPGYGVVIDQFVNTTTLSWSSTGSYLIRRRQLIDKTGKVKWGITVDLINNTFENWIRHPTNVQYEEFITSARFYTDNASVLQSKGIAYVDSGVAGDTWMAVGSSRWYYGYPVFKNLGYVPTCVLFAMCGAGANGQNGSHSALGISRSGGCGGGSGGTALGILDFDKCIKFSGGMQEFNNCFCIETGTPTPWGTLKTQTTETVLSTVATGGEHQLRRVWTKSGYSRSGGECGYNLMGATFIDWQVNTEVSTFNPYPLKITTSDEYPSVYLLKLKNGQLGGAAGNYGDGVYNFFGPLFYGLTSSSYGNPGLSVSLLNRGGGAPGKSSEESFTASEQGGGGASCFGGGGVGAYKKASSAKEGWLGGGGGGGSGWADCESGANGGPGGFLLLY